MADSIRTDELPESSDDQGPVQLLPPAPHVSSVPPTLQETAPLAIESSEGHGALASPMAEPTTKPDEKKAPRPAVPVLPRSQEIADKTALLLIDIGSPENADDVKGFLTRVYADDRVFDSPFGAFGRWALTAIFRASDAKNLKKTLEAVGGRSPEGASLSQVATSLCERFSIHDGLPAFTPFTAFQYALPSIEQVLTDIRAQGFTQIVALWVRPFRSLMGASAREALLRTAEFPGTPPIAFIEGWMESETIPLCLSTLVQDTLGQLPEPLRKSAHIAFALQALPIEGNRDPAFSQAKMLAKTALDVAGLTNAHSIVYLDALAPRASLSPTFEDLFDRLGKSKPPILVVPLNHLTENLAMNGELDVLVTCEAARRGFKYFLRTPMLGTHPAILDEIEATLIRHLSFSNEFREQATARGR